MTDENESSDTTPEAIDAENIMHLGSGSFAVYDPDSVTHYTVKIGHDRIEVLDHSESPPANVTDDSEDGILYTRLVRSVVASQPDTLSVEMSHQRVVNDQVQYLIDLAQNMDGSGGGGGSGGSGGSDGGDADGPVFDSGSFEGSDDLEEQLNEWIDNYANVKADLDPDAVEITAGEYDGTNGFQIDSNPFKAGYYDSSAGEWDDKDSYDDHNDAFKSVMQDADGVQYVEVADDDYNINFVSAEDVEDVTG